MPARHFTQHGSDPDGDALDSYHSQDDILDGLTNRWHSDITQWDRGTLAKLVLEHAAVREAAIEVLAEHLDNAGHNDTAKGLLAGCQQRRKLLSDLDRATVGHEPAAIAADADAEHTVIALFELIGEERTRKTFASDLDRLAESFRDDLPSAKKVRKHAPTRLGDHDPRWYDGLSVASRLHAAYDRMRGFPWPESKPFMDNQLAKDFDQEEA